MGSIRLDSDTVRLLDEFSGQRLEEDDWNEVGVCLLKLKQAQTVGQVVEVREQLRLLGGHRRVDTSQRPVGPIPPPVLRNLNELLAPYRQPQPKPG